MLNNMLVRDFVITMTNIEIKEILSCGENNSKGDTLTSK